MRVLHISNFSTVRCGVAEFGRQLSAAARAAGVDLTDWDGSYPECYRRGYFPEDVYRYDLIHFNWQPGTLNHYQPEVCLDLFPTHTLSGLLHDLPPWSTWTMTEYLDVKAALEPYQDYVVIPPPCLPPRRPVHLSLAPTIGRTGIGSEGEATLVDICRRHRWGLSTSPDVWQSNEAELDRLARCWVNVVWYDTNRSRSSSASVVASARRPTILSTSSRFDHLKPWADEFYWIDVADPALLEEQLVELVKRIGGLTIDGQIPLVRVPDRSVQALQWDRLITPLISAWEAACAS